MVKKVDAMNIVVGLPPVYDEIVAWVGKPPETALYTYGDTIYNPSGGEVSDDLVAHERVHAHQQATIGVRKWWDRWLAENQFRAQQELDAYKAQFKFYAAMYHDRNVQARFATKLAGFLSGPMYGSPLKFQEAYKGIRG